MSEKTPIEPMIASCCIFFYSTISYLRLVSLNAVYFTPLILAGARIKEAMINDTNIIVDYLLILRIVNIQLNHSSFRRTFSFNVLSTVND